MSKLGGKISSIYAQSNDISLNNELIKKIISKKKTEKKLLKYAEVRAEVKRSKSRDQIDKSNMSAQKQQLNVQK
jgi:predicted site-specific integrase-resolvase